MTDWQALRRIMPNPKVPDVVTNWGHISESWGKEFPPDYREFMNLYGVGEIEDCLSILEPEPQGQGANPKGNKMVAETRNAEFAWTHIGRGSQVAVADPYLIAWGLSVSADILCWDAAGDDPAMWPVLMVSSDLGEWRRYDCGMVDFLLKLFRSDFEEYPLSDSSLLGLGAVTFLPQSEVQRLWRAGLDPWTGESDPYADMYPPVPAEELGWSKPE